MSRKRGVQHLKRPNRNKRKMVQRMNLKSQAGQTLIPDWVAKPVMEWSALRRQAVRNALDVVRNNKADLRSNTHADWIAMENAWKSVEEAGRRWSRSGTSSLSTWTPSDLALAFAGLAAAVATEDREDEAIKAKREHLPQMDKGLPAALTNASGEAETLGDHDLAKTFGVMLAHIGWAFPARDLCPPDGTQALLGILADDGKISPEKMLARANFVPIMPDAEDGMRH